MNTTVAEQVAGTQTAGRGTLPTGRARKGTGGGNVGVGDGTVGEPRGRGRNEMEPRRPATNVWEGQLMRDVEGIQRGEEDKDL